MKGNKIMLWELLRMFFIVLFLSPLIAVGALICWLCIGQPKQFFARVLDRVNCWLIDMGISFQFGHRERVMPPMEVKSAVEGSGISSVCAKHLTERKIVYDEETGNTKVVTADVATVCLRYFPKQNLVKGLMLLFGTPAKKRYSSMYDLGVVNSSGFHPEVVSAFVEAAKTKLKDLGKIGMSRRKAEDIPLIDQVEHEASAFMNGKRPKVVKAPEAVPDNQAPVIKVLEDVPPEEKDEAQAKTIPFKPNAAFLAAKPVSYKGEILEINRFKKGEYMVHGVKLRLANGSEYICFGVDLIRAVEEADVAVGDYVEITRVGRKQINPDRPPMNLWDICKLAA
jgi:hypothetical protein